MKPSAEPRLCNCDDASGGRCKAEGGEHLAADVVCCRDCVGHEGGFAEEPEAPPPAEVAAFHRGVEQMREACVAVAEKGGAFKVANAIALIPRLDRRS